MLNRDTRDRLQSKVYKQALLHCDRELIKSKRLSIWELVLKFVRNFNY